MKKWDKFLIARNLQLKIFSHKVLATKLFIPHVLALIFILKSIQTKCFVLHFYIKNHGHMG
jgi:hypothetical protein